GLKIDKSGSLWVSTGQEGILTIAASSASAATVANPPKWTILSTGIEELVSMDMIIPPGSNDTILAAAADTTGFYITNPDNFSAVQIPLQQGIISQGTSVTYCPDAPSYVAITTSDVEYNGPNYSGYSTDGGASWTRFGPSLQFSCSIGECDIPAAMIAVSPRGSRTLGNDHIVIYPPENFAPQYSQDGGVTWHVTSSFPLNADGLSIAVLNDNYVSFIIPELNAHLLRADPFIADKFYLKFTHAPHLFYISTDGGQTWQGQANTNLPDWAWSGQLVVNGKLQNDLWYADGFAGSSSHGVFHSTNGGQTFQQLPGISHAITIAVGAGSGQPGDAPYTVYFYGLMTSSPAWGIFQSANNGSSWNRIAYYPTGLYDVPRTMAASQDTFGKVYLGLSGNSFIYGQIAPGAPPLPATPTGLSAAAVSNSEINLSWIAPPGAVTGFNVYRGTSPGEESTTPVATGLAAASYSDMNVAVGAQYYYTVAAINSSGTGPASSEASAIVPLLPSAPTALTAVATSNNAINLSWTAPSGTVTSYNIYRGTKSGQESTTPLATGVSNTAYSDKSASQGTEYYYEVTAVNVTGEGPVSNEASATAIQSSIALAAAAGASTSITVLPGQTASYQLVLTSTNYSGIVTFSCSGAPAGATCTVPAPANLTPASTTTTVNVSVQTTTETAGATTLSRGLIPSAAGFLLLPFCFRRKRRTVVAIITAAMAILAAANGCSSSGNPGSNPVVSTLTVSATGTGVTTASQSLTLTVQ
ncbi:MAG: fibronectin type III domain-containing protein, partial [Terracidiphilus sp.]